MERQKIIPCAVSLLLRPHAAQASSSQKAILTVLPKGVHAHRCTQHHLSPHTLSFPSVTYHSLKPLYLFTSLLACLTSREDKICKNRDLVHLVLALTPNTQVSGWNIVGILYRIAGWMNALLDVYIPLLLLASYSKAHFIFYIFRRCYLTLLDINGKLFLCICLVSQADYKPLEAVVWMLHSSYGPLNISPA